MTAVLEQGVAATAAHGLFVLDHATALVVRR